MWMQALPRPCFPTDDMIRTRQQSLIYRAAKRLPGHLPWQSAPALYRLTHPETKASVKQLIKVFGEHFPDASPQMVHQWAQQHIDLQAWELMDTMMLAQVGNPRRVALEVAGIEPLRRAVGTGQGIILIFNHVDRILGGGLAIARAGVPFHSLTMEIDDNAGLSSSEKAYLTHKVSTFQRLSGGMALRRNASMKRIYAGLETGEVWSILADAWHPSAKGKRAHNFLGRSLHLATGIERIATATGARMFQVTPFTRAPGLLEVQVRMLDTDPETAVNQAIQNLAADISERPWAWWNWGLIDVMSEQRKNSPLKDRKKCHI